MVEPNLAGRLRATTSRRAIETGLRGGWCARTVGASLLLSLALIAAAPAQATTFTVNTLNDVSGPGQTSLRDAITASNGGGAGNVINFTAGLNGSINLGSDLPAITNS